MTSSITPQDAYQLVLMNPIVGRHDVMKRQQVQQLLIAEGSRRSYNGSGLISKIHLSCKFQLFISKNLGGDRF